MTHLSAMCDVEPNQRLSFCARKTSGVVAVAALIFLSAWIGDALGSSGCITGRTLRDGGAGCGTCHSFDKTLGVNISGPTTLAIGTAGAYSIGISGATTNTNIGINVAASSGTLGESAANLQIISGELTHTGTLTNTLTGTTGSYAFTYTLPGAATVGQTYTLYGAAILESFGKASAILPIPH